MLRIDNDREKIERAREILQSCRELHLLPSPLVTWKADIFDRNNKQVEEIIAKSNSYNRNGLNLLFHHLCCPNITVISGLFQDGVVSYKTTAAGISSASYQHGTYLDSSTALDVGYSDTAENIDHYALQSVFGSGNSINQVNRGTTMIATSFDAGSRKFYNDISRSIGNGYGSAQDIKEIGLFAYVQRLVNTTGFGVCMLMRDVLDPVVSIPAGGAVIMHYNFEVQY